MVAPIPKIPSPVYSNIYANLQIVRADLHELMTMDLKGAPYGYTPFCSDRPEMAQFRFWDGGYWKEHLRGRPYHIRYGFFICLCSG